MLEDTLIIIKFSCIYVRLLIFNITIGIDIYIYNMILLNKQAHIRSVYCLTLYKDAHIDFTKSLNKN